MHHCLGRNKVGARGGSTSVGEWKSFTTENKCGGNVRFSVVFDSDLSSSSAFPSVGVDFGETIRSIMSPSTWKLGSTMKSIKPEIKIKSPV